ncbi:MAG: hypothetical protein R3D67_21315 [Hyphomicrobiaceae bacterium]
MRNGRQQQPDGETIVFGNCSETQGLRDCRSRAAKPRGGRTQWLTFETALRRAWPERMSVVPGGQMEYALTAAGNGTPGATDARLRLRPVLPALPWRFFTLTVPDPRTKELPYAAIPVLPSSPSVPLSPLGAH